MYIRRYTPTEEAAPEREVSVPENYAGNAFPPQEEGKKERKAENAPHDQEDSRSETEKAKAEPSSSHRLTELLPILLSVMLSDEYEDIGLVLLALLLL